MRFGAVLALAALAALQPAAGARAGSALIGVAANFAETATALERVFEAASGNDLNITAGSTGRLYAQITNGAPFDILLAADQVRPELLEIGGFAVAGSRFTYAVGHLSLWSPDAGLIGEDGAALLAAGGFRFLAIANPDLAPYGLAARQALQALGLWDALGERIVMGQNVAQVFSMVATGNAELGLIAKSYALSPRNGTPGSRWDVPPDLYDPIRQDAVLLSAGAANPAAIAFLEFLRTDAARDVIETFGYGVD
ncbi:MAG: molybdate ABC transporter substrate-binding protein [Paracoccaceae bacterium]